MHGSAPPGRRVVSQGQRKWIAGARRQARIVLPGERSGTAACPRFDDAHAGGGKKPIVLVGKAALELTPTCLHRRSPRTHGQPSTTCLPDCWLTSPEIAANSSPPSRVSSQLDPFQRKWRPPD